MKKDKARVIGLFLGSFAFLMAGIGGIYIQNWLVCGSELSLWVLALFGSYYFRRRYKRSAGYSQ